MKKYLQLFMWTYYDPVELREIIFREQPELIEWIAPEEAMFHMRDEYQILADYKRSQPDAQIRVLCGTMDFPDVDDNGIEFEGFPLFFIYDLASSLGDDAISKLAPAELKYKLFSANNHGHYFRCQLVDHFERAGLINSDNIVTWQNKRVSTHYQWRWFSPREITVDDIYATGGLNYKQFMPQYQEAFLDALSESAVHNIFLTEKTVKPILCLKPFIVWTAPGYHKFLASLGILLFDELIDYSFDAEPDDELRCQMFVEQARRINDMPLAELADWQQRLMPKLQANKSHLLGMMYDRNLHPKRVVEWRKYTAPNEDILIRTSATLNTRQEGWYHLAGKYNICQNT